MSAHTHTHTQGKYACLQRHTPPDVVSELEGCEQGVGRICDVVSLATGSEVLIFESGASRAFSLFACLVPL